MLELVQHGSIAKLVLLVAVILFHELGHYVGMVALGYRDVRMFFIPLIGGAVSGSRGRGSQTREAIVLLLGPVPGIVFGLSTAVAAVMLHSLALKTVAEYLLAINLLNLLPVMPLDGGRLASVLLFSRWRWTEGLFTGGTLAAAIVFCLANGAWVFAAVAFFLLLVVPKIAADWMAQVLETACRRAPSFGRSVALSAAWAAALVAGLFALGTVGLLK